jgi:hypothetical protein
MTDRPILRLPNPSISDRLKARQDKRRRPKGVGRQGQGARLGGQFTRLEEAFRGENPDFLLRQDPAGIAPERALVFEAILPIQNFQKAAAKIGFELLIEDRIDDDYEIPEELIDDNVENAQPTLYATMPSDADLRKLLQMWRAYQRGEKAERGLAPWWNLFGMLADIRVWGPQDRLTPEARSELSYRLSEDDNAPIRLELEIWPTANADQRARWLVDTRARVESFGGRIVDARSISETGFIYEAVLVEMPSLSVREMLENPFAPNGLASIEGLQFVLPQTVGQSLPDLTDDEPQLSFGDLRPFDVDAPIKAVLLDGTPIAGHPALDGGVVIEDVHDIVRLSQVAHRRHATSMASLMLRGDLLSDGAPIPNGRVLAIPVLVDQERDAVSPNDRLFVDIVHVALARAFLGENALAPDAYLVNFSIGIKGAHFAGRISSLARLLDWWADQQGILFHVSAGNVAEDLAIPNMTTTAFEDATPEERRAHIETAQRNARHRRTLMAPAEAMNVVTVGAASLDETAPTSPVQAGVVPVHEDGEITPALSSAIGLGAFRSIKPDFLALSGEHEVRATPGADHVRLNVLAQTQRTGLNVATVQRGNPSTYRARGTSCANAMASRASLFAVSALSEIDGPFDGVDLTTRDQALITKALSVNASRWPEAAITRYQREMVRLDGNHNQAREEVCRYYGHGTLNDALMREAPDYGATLVGIGTLRKDQAAIFNVPMPPSLAGERIGRSMLVTIAWFSPVLATRARYRLALLEAVAHGHDLFGGLVDDDGWALDLRVGQLNKNIIKRGTVWSHRMIHNGATVPNFGGDKVLPIRVQCREGAGLGSLSPDDDIRFALAVTLEVESEADLDVHAEVQERLRVGIRNPGN